MFGRALRRTFGDGSVFWMAPFLGFLWATGLGSFFAAGYVLSYQDAVVNEEEGLPSFDIDQVYFGLKFMVAHVLLQVPVLLVAFGLLGPAFAVLPSVALGEVLEPETTRTVVGQASIAGGLLLLWFVAYGAYLPALMLNFMAQTGRFSAALDFRKATAIAWHRFDGYLRMLGWMAFLFVLEVVVVWAAYAIGGAFVLYPVGIVLVLPAAAASFLVLQAMLAEMRVGLAREEREYAREGWHHLSAQTAATETGFVSDSTPEAPS